MSAPHIALRYIRPDEVAECWEDVTDDQYRTLWQIMRFAKRYDGETPPEPDVNSVASLWDYLSDDEQESLNALAVLEEARRERERAEYEARRAPYGWEVVEGGARNDDDRW